jgi:stage III sporulation protein SpoIIIAA
MEGEGSTEPLPDLGTLSDDDLKALIDKLTQEENDVSFRRRLLQGRIDILRAERTARLKGKGVTDVDVEKLTDILSSRSAPSSEEGARVTFIARNAGFRIRSPRISAPAAARCSTRASRASRR